MAKVILICGKLCSGKSTYAEALCTRRKAVLLSVDEIMLALFGQYAGDKHDEYAQKTKAYLFEKSLKILSAGTDVVLDWGFWTKEDRDYAKVFYSARGVTCELHYIDISDEVWRTRLRQRNHAVSVGEANAYFVDEDLAAKFDAIFEPPEKDEIDVPIRC